MSATAPIHPRHFALLRLAKMRQLPVRHMGRGVYAVGSHSRPGHFHKISAGVCPCDATDYCTHKALALNDAMLNSPSPSERVEYLDAQRVDFAEMELRILQGVMTAEDRRYARPAFLKVMERVKAEESRPRREFVCDF